MQLTHEGGSHFTDAIASLHTLIDTSFHLPTNASLTPERRNPQPRSTDTHAQVTSGGQSLPSDNRGTIAREPGGTQPLTDDRGTAPADNQGTKQSTPLLTRTRHTDPRRGSNVIVSCHAQIEPHPSSSMSALYILISFVFHPLT